MNYKCDECGIDRHPDEDGANMLQGEILCNYCIERLVESGFIESLNAYRERGVI